MTGTTAATPEPQFGRVLTSPAFPGGQSRPVTVATRRAGRTDLVLEGGGVKGLGLVGATLALDRAGFTFNRIAGASAGAIVAALLAALQAKARPVSSLTDILNTIDYSKFAPRGLIHDGMAAFQLFAHQGLYDGGYLRDWLGAQLQDLGVRTFGDLAIDDDQLPPERRYNLVVTTSDITRGKSVRLPWDYPLYGMTADDQPLVDAVRASMSIPFFFEPVHVQARAATVASVEYPAEECVWVDGGMLDNFPVDVFARPDAGPGRWPTIGVKLSAQGPPSAHRTNGALAEARACLSTLTDNADRFYVVPADAQRTIFVDHGDVQTTDFGITAEQQTMLLTNGRTAAEAFVAALPE